jgi:uncharacterized protein YndB with AHSA1/START domain
MPGPAQVTLPSDREVRVTRRFNAPRQLVWDAHTKSELLPKWLGYDGWDMPVREMDVRVGGKYRWQWKNQEDGDMGGAMPAGDPCMVSLDLSEQNGVTTLVCTMKFASKEARDGAVSTGMTDGMEFSYARLDDMFAKQAA